MARPPIIPPYTPEQGITQSPARPGHRRPPMGMAEEERRIQEHTRRALEIVRACWPFMSVAQLMETIKARCPGVTVTPTLVYALKRRLDTARRNRPE